MSDLKHTLSAGFSFSPANTSFNEPMGTNEAHDGYNTDVKLWKAFNAGEEAIFVQLYTEYVNILFNYGCQFTADREMVTDCLQDFVIYLRNLRKNFRDTTSLTMYLLNPFRRRVIDYINS